MDIAEIRKKAKALEESRNAEAAKDIDNLVGSSEAGASMLKTDDSNEVQGNEAVAGTNAKEEVVDIVSLEVDMGEELQSEIDVESLHLADEEHSVDDIIVGDFEPVKLMEELGDAKDSDGGVLLTQSGVEGAGQIEEVIDETFNESQPAQKDKYSEEPSMQDDTASADDEDVFGGEGDLKVNDDLAGTNTEASPVEAGGADHIDDDAAQYAAVDKRGLLGLAMLEADDELELQKSQEVVEELEAIMFDLGDETYGINIENIEEVVTVQSLTEVPRAPAGILGIITLRGMVIPIIDVKSKLNLGSSSDGERIIIVELHGTRFGFFADKVLNVITVNKADIEEPPIINTVNADLLEGIGRHRGKRFILLDLSSLVMEEA